MALMNSPDQVTQKVQPRQDFTGQVDSINSQLRVHTLNNNKQEIKLYSHGVLTIRPVMAVDFCARQLAHRAGPGPAPVLAGEAKEVLL